MRMNDWYISKSNIHGDGIFTRRAFKQHEPISIIFIKVHDSGIPADDLVRTEFCKYVNHNKDNPNTSIYKKKHYFILKALRDLEPHEEVSTNYNEGLAKLISGGFPDELDGDQDSLNYIPHRSHIKNPVGFRGIDDDSDKDIDPIF